MKSTLIILLVISIFAFLCPIATICGITLINTGEPFIQTLYNNGGLFLLCFVVSILGFLLMVKLANKILF